MSYFLSLTLTALLSLASPENGIVKTNDALIKIVLSPDNETTPVRGTEVLYIDGYVDVLSGAICLIFHENIGNVCAEVEESVNGDYYCTFFGGSGTIFIPYALSPGNWEITLTTTAGTVYHGEFII